MTKFCQTIGIAILLSVVVVAHQQEKEDWTWLQENFPRLLEELMPMKGLLGSHVVYRAVQDLRFDVPEYSFVIGFDDKPYQPTTNRLTARIIQPDKTSIYAQLMQLHKEFPRASIKVLQAKIKIAQRELDERNCPAIRKAWDNLQDLRMSPPRSPEPEVVYLHPLVHDFTIASLQGEMTAKLEWQEHELVKWATTTKEALARCK